MQNEALRAIAGLTASCPVDFLHLETGIEPIRDRFAKNNKLMRERHLRMPQDDPRIQLMEKKATVKLKTRQGLRHATESYPEEANFDRATTKSMYPPWRVTRPVFDKVPLEKKDGVEERMCWPAGKYCSSYGAECVAFLRALEWAEENHVMSVAICTDSLSLHQALERDDWRTGG